MNRRSFLASMLAAGAAPYVMSGGIGRGVLMQVREIVIPSTETVSAVNNELLTIDMITKEALLILEKNLVLTRNINTERESCAIVTCVAGMPRQWSQP